MDNKWSFKLGVGQATQNITLKETAFVIETIRHMIFQTTRTAPLTRTYAVYCSAVCHQARECRLQITKMQKIQKKRLQNDQNHYHIGKVKILQK